MSTNAPFELIPTESPDSEDLAFIERRLDEHNVSVTGITDARALAIVVRDETGAIVAGLSGFTWGGCCEVRTLWVHDGLRGTGLGTRLMAAAETEARARGTTQMVLSTHTFQAPAFYARLGFVEVGRVDDYPAGAGNIYLVKALAATA